MGYDLNGYEIVSPLHKGQNSTLYLARQNNSAQTFVVKVCNARPDDPQRLRKLERFSRQFDDQKVLEHQNIVRILDRGSTPEGNQYLILENAGDLPLSSIGGRLNELAIGYFGSIFSQSCAALQYAHELGVIHRDLTANDILLSCTEDGGLLVRITDFTKGSPLLHGDNWEQQLTENGDLFGDAEFMSPEEGQSGKVDERSNIYSLACIMYFSLSGTTPHEAPHWGAVLIKKMKGDPIPRLALKQSKSIENRVNAILTKCLLPDPNKRYQSMAELKEALDGLSSKREQPISYSKIASKRTIGSSNPIAL